MQIKELKVTIKEASLDGYNIRSIQVYLLIDKNRVSFLCVCIEKTAVPKRKKLKRRRSSIHSKEVYKNISVISREFRQDSYLIGKHW